MLHGIVHAIATTVHVNAIIAHVIVITVLVIANTVLVTVIIAHATAITRVLVIASTNPKRKNNGYISKRRANNCSISLPVYKKSG